MTKQQHSLFIDPERLKQDVQRFTLMDDTFMSLALKDKDACQYVIQTILGKPDLIVEEVRTQEDLPDLLFKGVRLDILAKDSQGKLYNIEVQKADNIDHAKRIRDYAAHIDMRSLQKGDAYAQLPDLYCIYISKTDIWGLGHSAYPIRKFLGDTGVRYEDGLEIVYVNAGVDDGSAISRLMKYFLTSDPGDDSHGALSKQVQYYKSSEEGESSMCEITKRYFMEGREEGREEGGIETAVKSIVKLLRKGIPLSEIWDYADCPPGTKDLCISSAMAILASEEAN